MVEELSPQVLIQLAGGAEYVMGYYRAAEGLVKKMRVLSHMVLGQVWDGDLYWTRLQLAPPFEARCTCPRDGACRHAVALGLTLLWDHPSRTVRPADTILYDVPSLETADLRALVMDLLAAHPGGPAMAVKYLVQREIGEKGCYCAERDALEIRHRLRELLSDDLVQRGAEAVLPLAEVDALLRTITMYPSRRSPFFLLLTLTGCVAELTDAFGRLGSWADRWRSPYLHLLEQTEKISADLDWSDHDAVAGLNPLIEAYSVAGPYAALRLKAAICAVAANPVVRKQLLAEGRRTWRGVQGVHRKRLRQLIKELEARRPESDRPMITWAQKVRRAYARLS